MDGIECVLLDERERTDAVRIAEIVADWKPNVLVLSGWAVPGYVRLVDHPALRQTRRVMTMDNPFRGDWRQRLGAFRLASYLRKMDNILLPGERAWQLANYWRVPQGRIFRGLYGVDCRRLTPLHTKRVAHPDGWPKAFLFVGQLEPRKGIDLLLAGYRDYSRQVCDPWPLRCCGMGACEEAVRSTPGVEHLGFVQPAQIPDVFLSHGVFILPSRYDAWPLVLVEACAAGLPVVCSEACGSAVEVVRPHYNGLLCPTGSSSALTDAMRWIHEHHHLLPEWGARAMQLAAPYSAECWAERFVAMIESPVRSSL